MASDLISGQISFAGLGSGTDFSALIEGLINIEKRRITSLQTWKQTWEDKVTEFKDLNSKMLNLRTTLQKMDTVNEFLAKTVSSSNTSVLTATASGDSASSTHSVEVHSLATNEVFITTSGTSSLSSSVTSANTNLTFSYAGTTYTLSNISAGTTMQELVNRINSDTATKSHIEASYLYDGTTYHLQLTGKDMGADNQIVISNTGSLIFGVSDFTETQNATNAQLRVNGFPSAAGGYIERSTNTITDIIEGVTLNLQSASPGTSVTVKVATDTTAVKENIRSFVDSVNEIRKKILDITNVDTSTDDVKGSILTGNYGIQMIQQDLNDLLASKGLAFEYYDSDTGAGDYYTSLGQIGIYTDTDKGSETFGQLLILEDTTDPDLKFKTLDYALANHPDDVAYLFSAKLDGESASSDLTFVDVIEGMTSAGVHEVSIITSNTGISSATINGEPVSISADGLTITGSYGTAAAGLSVKLSNFQANTTINGEINVKNGKVNELIDELGDLTKEYNAFTKDGGPLNVLVHNYGDIMDSIDDKIAFETARIATKEQRLKLKFSRLDTVLQKYAGIQTSLNSQLAQLNQ
ncbi:flagellar filament capping protein FliD [Salidesulfovibrio onnuriiensis]|uniref:flagellar filament capping protein FliD n=1 Tax=Salidesulfovibrio onnuriiensis TaxID=2583823 RepID=UPI0011CADB70|nr:flagellar filament capping protein FliD [Salidesulfovibrio onnuriiensis]